MDSSLYLLGRKIIYFTEVLATSDINRIGPIDAHLQAPGREPSRTRRGSLVRRQRSGVQIRNPGVNFIERIHLFLPGIIRCSPQSASSQSLSIFFIPGKAGNRGSKIRDNLIHGSDANL